MSKAIPVGVSARHVHVTREHLAILFGEGYQLTVKKPLSQPGQFASEEQVDLITEKGSFKKVRILGPERPQTQVEISLTDALKLGIKPPVRDSGNLKGSPGLTIVGPKGQVTIEEGVIAACRHIHMTKADAAELGLKDKDIVKIAFGGERSLIFDQVLIRVSDNYKLDCHLDTDEANAAKIGNSDTVELLK
ncbi:phosphate propanoyltransferase [Sporomusa sp. KB1]|jgi:putative phosphotransacetylase|uniref:phosphate propanoyltransferase n=1 Tax=Sporomusa sp. KB1 TaxID=943346 RepID=UPI0011A45F27|nr:phosphate propanoyltransferase [Sporomusa sp. KB1]TWH49132.1 putative phosphotransacetylase [Sporomusa sp. KB1]